MLTQNISLQRTFWREYKPVEVKTAGLEAIMFLSITEVIRYGKAVIPLGLRLADEQARCCLNITH